MATAEKTRVDLPVKGMHCAACVGKVERALQGVPGVDRAAVNLATERATVWLDPAEAGVSSLRTAVAAAGYTVPDEIAATPETADRERVERAQEDRRLRERLLVGVALSVPVLLGSMPGIFPWAPELLRNPWVLLALTTPVQFWVGWPFHAAFVKELRHRSASMNTLVSVGTGAAYFFSLAVTLWPHRFMATGAMPYYEASALLITFLVLGRWLEARARGGASDAIRRLVALQPRTARVLRAGGEVDLPIASVAVGDRLRVRPGERVAVDGIVEDGASSVDESMLTGESLPVERSAGDGLMSGSLNGEAAVGKTAAEKPVPPAIAVRDPKEQPARKTANLQSTPVTKPDAVVASSRFAEPQGKGVVFQVQAFPTIDAAEALAARLKSKGYPTFVLPNPDNPRGRYRVRVGKYSNKSEAETVFRRLKQEENFKPWRIP